jgi:predicted secreted protein
MEAQKMLQRLSQKNSIRYIQLLLLFLLLQINSYANNDRALYIKQYSNESKIALIIGNGQYSHFSKLKNAKNDAYDMNNVLKNQGFETLYLEDGTLKDMKKIVRKFSKKLRNGGVGFFYYAGHGVEVDGQNYLIPTNAQIPEKNEVEYEALSMNMIIDKMEDSNNRLNIVVLDACRNDPFSRSGGGGLAQINNAKGMYIAYATAPGKVASDGSGKNGLFTTYLMQNIQKPNLKLNDVFAKTRKEVYEKSNNKQLPWTSSSVIGDFYFKVNNNDINYEQPKQNKKPQEQSTFSFSNKLPTHFSIKINPTPYDAKVTITNINQKYYDGIKLQKGNYDIEVSKEGYLTKKGTISLKNNIDINIALDKVVVNKPIVQTKTNSNVNLNVEKQNFAKTNKLFQKIFDNFKNYQSTQIRLKIPQIAENGLVVPTSIEIKDSQKGKLYLFTDANKDNFIISYESFLNNNKHQYSTRIKMEKSGYIYAVFVANSGKTIATRAYLKTVAGESSSNSSSLLLHVLKSYTF